MKLLFNRFVFYILGIVFFSSLILAKEINSEYAIEVGKLDIGKLYWSIVISETEYKIFIKLQDSGIFSGLYDFSGNYTTEGRVINKSLVPLSYKQKWVTKKKKRNVELYFINGSVSKLNLFPKETMPPKTEFMDVSGVVDPLSSFVSILKNNNSSKTIDGRRFYKMVVAQENSKNNIITKSIKIEDYLNIWADHNKNDLTSIQFDQIDDADEMILPHRMKIKYKGLTFAITKI